MNTWIKLKLRLHKSRRAEPPLSETPRGARACGGSEAPERFLACRFLLHYTGRSKAPDLARVWGQLCRTLWWRGWGWNVCALGGSREKVNEWSVDVSLLCVVSLVSDSTVGHVYSTSVNFTRWVIFFPDKSFKISGSHFPYLLKDGTNLDDH